MVRCTTCVIHDSELNYEMELLSSPLITRDPGRHPGIIYGKLPVMGIPMDCCFMTICINHESYIVAKIELVYIYIY